MKAIFLLDLIIRPKPINKSSGAIVMLIIFLFIIYYRYIYVGSFIVYMHR